MEIKNHKVSTMEEVCLMTFDQNTTMLGECHSTTRPPLFNGDNYFCWKTRMKLFIQANDYKVWRVIINGQNNPIKRESNSIIVLKDEDDWDQDDIKMA
ncbi:hypothetical protein J1N35_029072 [Gossypium stocksii]|uniref:DUF4219 domain-containing protein n=1 Tax=Gossypium stocksii TaxID=47602 RepID=A0A9D3UXF7_9ROSI|nr:hypothetical protein J1N35_029072 [Gossypium stocksii]